MTQAKKKPGLLERVAPRRAMARHSLAMVEKTFGKNSNALRSFDAVAGGRTQNDFLSETRSPDSAVTDSIESLRQRVRQEEYNSGLVRGPIRRLVNNVVGQGIKPQAIVRADSPGESPPIADGAPITAEIAKAFNAQIERAWERWAGPWADVRLLSTLYEIQALTEGALVRDGEVLVVERESNRMGRPIPFCLEIFEADRLATPIDQINNPAIKNGIEFDADGAPVAYWIAKSHPGDTMILQTMQFERVPAWNSNGTRRVMHLYSPVRPEQTRGFSEFAAALSDLGQVGRYKEAELFAALMDACTVAVHTTADPDALTSALTSKTDSNSNRVVDFFPGTNYFTAPGEEINFHTPARPNKQYQPFVDSVLSVAANSLDIPPEVFSQAWAGLNYSNARTVLTSFYKACKQRQQYLLDHFCQPVWESFVRHAVFYGMAKAPGFDRRPWDYTRVDWKPNGWDWIDPAKEAQGHALSVENNFVSLSDVCSSRGKDWESVLEQRAREKVKQKELEEEFDIDLSASEGGTPVPMEEDSDAPKKEDDRKIHLLNSGGK